MRFLQGISAPNLEVRRHDITKDEIEEREYDLVHCRYVLEHLIEPEKALKRMADAVRPSGWLLIEESDMVLGCPPMSRTHLPPSSRRHVEPCLIFCGREALLTRFLAVECMSEWKRSDS